MCVVCVVCVVFVVRVVCVLCVVCGVCIVYFIRGHIFVCQDIRMLDFDPCLAQSPGNYR